METSFTRLNDGWNAEPNVPIPRVSVDGNDVVVTFILNFHRYKRFLEGQQAFLRFHECWRYRLGATNDEGWDRGQCRFSRMAPEWGEFYEVSGDLRLEATTEPWRDGPATSAHPSKHFLFYFRDETFECDAASWSVEFGEVDTSW